MEILFDWKEEKANWHPRNPHENKWPKESGKCMQK